MQIIQAVKNKVTASQLFLLFTAALAFLIPFNNKDLQNLAIIGFIITGVIYAIKNWKGIQWSVKWPFLLLGQP